MSYIRVIFLCIFLNKMGMPPYGLLKMWLGGGKRWLATIEHYSRKHYLNNKLYSYLNAQMCTSVLSFNVIVLKIP